MAFEEIDPELLKDNTFHLIGKEWMLITAGDAASFNVMTASWGGLGVLWDKKVCFCFIRPTRYTYQFANSTEYFTLSFFSEKYREALRFCGSHSGRKVNKVAKAGLTPHYTEQGIFFEEARLVLQCRKIYFQDITPENFLDPEIMTKYPLKDYHRMYVGAIERCLSRK